MGLDIIQGFDIEESDEGLELYQDCGDRDKYQLSRTFCNFVCRKDVIEGEPDLDQIGRICGTDINPIYEMERYMPSWEMDEFIEIEEKENPIEFRKTMELENQKIFDNIDRIIDSLNQLIPTLERFKDLTGRINDNGFPTIHSDYYRNLDTDEIGNYVNNNLSQDLRNLLRYSMLAKSLGARTTFFTYG